MTFRFCARGLANRFGRCRGRLACSLTVRSAAKSQGSAASVASRIQPFGSPNLLHALVSVGIGAAAAQAWASGSVKCDTRTKVTVLRVEGMGCQGCVGTVKRSLEALESVEGADVDLEGKIAIVRGTAPAQALVSAVMSTGTRAELVGISNNDGFVEMTPVELKASLAKSGKRGFLLDIDETLSATNVVWFQRLAEAFGNPEGTSIEDLISKYHLAQNVPFWQTPEAFEWMQKQRDDPRAQDGIPRIPGAVEGVHALGKIVNLVGYCTVRPDAVNANTIIWLRENGFVDLPVVAKPAHVPFADGNKWKAHSLHEMWPEVQGIVDDNPKLPLLAGDSYSGKIFLFGHASGPPSLDFVIPCSTWPEVVRAAQARCA